MKFDEFLHIFAFAKYLPFFYEIHGNGYKMLDLNFLALFFKKRKKQYEMLRNRKNEE